MESFVPLPLPEEGASEQQFSQRMSQQRQALAEIYPAVLARIKANQERQHVAFAKTHPMVTTGEKNLPEGTLVMLLDPNYKAMNKNEPPYEGIYRVTTQDEKGAYTLVDKTGRTLHRNVNREWLKVLTGAVSDAPQDANMYFVQDILDHKVDPKTKLDSYKVRWAGFGPEHEWLPASDIGGSLVRRYLQTVTRLPGPTKHTATSYRTAAQDSLPSTNVTHMVDRPKSHKRKAPVATHPQPAINLTQVTDRPKSHKRKIPASRSPPPTRTTTSRGNSHTTERSPTESTSSSIRVHDYRGRARL